MANVEEHRNDLLAVTFSRKRAWRVGWCGGKVYYTRRHSIFPDRETYLKRETHKFRKYWFHVRYLKITEMEEGKVIAKD